MRGVGDARVGEDEAYRGLVVDTGATVGGRGGEAGGDGSWIFMSRELVSEFESLIDA